MDTTELYIKMSDCPEVQLKRKIQLGDYMALRGTDITAICVHGGLLCRFDGINVQNPQSEWIKLFRQDQIQKMLGWEPVRLFEQFYHFMGKCIDYRYEFWKQVQDSSEQLWLAFYMYEKHSKIWDGDKWLKKQ